MSKYQKTGCRQENHPTSPCNSWQKYEIPTSFDKRPVEKQKQDALFPHGFRRIYH